LIGFGKVGQSLAEMLSSRHNELRKNYGLSPKVVAIVDRGGAAVSKEGINLSEALNAKRIGGSVSTLKGCGKPDLRAVEVTSTNLETGEPGLTNIKKALTLGMHVVTTNKGPLALSLPSLVDLANKRGVLLRFSGAVGGTIPVLDFDETCLYGDQIESVRGVLNSTTNYILWRMAESHLSLSDALKEAERLGYAERNVSYDLNGLDTASKLVIIAYHVMKRKVSLKDVQVKGIKDITLKEILKAEKEGFAIRLIGSINKQIKVSPQKIRIEDPLCVDSVYNAVEFKCAYSGRHILIGPGAGAKETASSIIDDIVYISRKSLNPPSHVKEKPILRVTR